MPGGGPLSVRIGEKRFRGSPSSGDGAGRDVLRDVAFDGAPGEILALFGPSGTGKTTTLRIVLGLDRDFVGSVRRPEGRVGVVFQEPLLLPWMTVREALDLFEKREADALVVVDHVATRRVVGTMSESHALRRYSEELERQQPDNILR